ncbi:DNA-binding response regulator [Planococcus maritimus]|uniref:response regulator transcription factor n=1 Tax=Planococcus maritimus TaxID=192421 RepID=UPI00080F1923|nr:response regulator [Planococcus maritimus]ANU16246.1 DNA-binding response regulator [Planococcus maritimus]
MFKLLLVDDEPIEREGMKAILERSFEDIEIKQAKNGKLAVEIAADWQPDIIFMDIMMPVMTGLEAIERIRETDPEVEVVMMTAFDTFDYAKQAIKLGVKDYLLKPSKAAEIVAIAEKLFNHLKKKAQQQSSLQKAMAIVEMDIVTQLLFDQVQDMHIDLLVEMKGAEPATEKFVMTIAVPRGAEEMCQDIKREINGMPHIWAGPCYDRQLPLIIFRDPAHSFRSQAITLADKILSASGKRDRCFVGIGTVCDSFGQVRDSYQKSLVAMSDLAIPSRYRFYAADLEPAPSRNPALIKQQEKRMADCVRLGDWEAVEEIITGLIRQLERMGEPVLRTQQRSLEWVWLSNRIMAELGVETDAPYYVVPVTDYRQLMMETSDLINVLKQNYDMHFNRLEFDKIHQIKQFITEHSHEDISLEVLARKVDLSPIYISKLFKEKLGINYIDFLTECRMGKAKKLLADPEISLKAIALEVGYHEPNYFSKVFKKMTELSPTEYRSNLLNSKRRQGIST